MMKIFNVLFIALAFALVVSCEKPQSDEEKRAQVEKEVQQRLAAEHQADDQQKLAQQQANLDAREKALTQKEAAAARTAIAAGRPTATPRAAAVRKNRDTSGRHSTASYGTFYRKLEPYGAWFETNDYGYVWQPHEAESSRTWRPYTDGHWAYSDAGWTWISEEPHGWATYHYGRWTRLRNVGWVWVPGDEWAPAWVSFRQSNDYVGWAPLPPEAQFDQRTGIHNWADNYYDISPQRYTFVPANEFGAQRAERVIVPPEQNVTIINETTNVTNITYSNTTIINGGPSYDELRSRSQQPIERYRLERQTGVNDQAMGPVVRGEVLQLPAPTLNTMPGMDRPRTLKETITQAVVEDGWAAITDRAAAQSARTKMKSEATPPPNAPSKTFVKPEAAPAAAAVSSSVASPSVSASATASPVASASVSETTPAPRPTSTPRPTASATAAATATATPTPTPTPTAAATETAIAAATATPQPTASAPVSIPTASSAPETTPVAQTVAQQRQAADQAKRAADKQRNEMKRAEEELKREQFRKAKTKAQEDQAIAPPTENADTPAVAGQPNNRTRPGRPGRISAPTAAPSAPAVSAESAVTPTATPTPAPTLTPQPTAPLPIVTPPPNQTSTDATPAAPEKRGDAAQPAAAADASVTPSVAASPADAGASSAAPGAKGKGKMKRNRPGQPGGDEPEPSPSGTAEPE